jgi:hypothetical protein
MRLWFLGLIEDLKKRLHLSFGDRSNNIYPCLTCLIENQLEDEEGGLNCPEKFKISSKTVITK